MTGDSKYKFGKSALIRVTANCRLGGESALMLAKLHITVYTSMYDTGNMASLMRLEFQFWYAW